MDGVPANYLGRLVSKNNFRTYIYAPNGSQKLVESWDAYEQHMETGLWFATKEDATASVVIIEPPKPKRERKSPTIKVGEPNSEEDALKNVPDDSLGHEVQQDDFLPK